MRENVHIWPFYKVICMEAYNLHKIALDTICISLKVFKIFKKSEIQNPTSFRKLLTNKAELGRIKQLLVGSGMTPIPSRGQPLAGLGCKNFWEF